MPIRYLLTLIFLGSGPLRSLAQQSLDYRAYHQQVIQAEQLIAQRQYAPALAVLENTFAANDHGFLREYKVATQLALQQVDLPKALSLLEAGIGAGWTWQAIKKTSWLAPLRKNKDNWRQLRTHYSTRHQAYEQQLNQPLRAEVQAMARQDQRLALAHLLRPSKRARARFLNRKFIPHSERQLIRLKEILLQHGYPGELRIGNNSWMARILSHHNSISVAYNQQDTLYRHLQPYLLEALQRGELAPADYAIIDEWFVVTTSTRQQGVYGYLQPLTAQELPAANARRQRIGLRSVELRNELVVVQQLTNLDLLLDGTFWVKGKIPVVTER